MVQTTTFNEIPYDWLKPGTYVEVRPNYQRLGLVPFPVQALLIVQKLASGTAEAKKLYRVTRYEEGSVLFGPGSIGDQMVRAFRKKANRTNDVYVIALDDLASGTKASGKFAFTGAGDGPVSLYINTTRIRVGGTALSSPTDRAAAAVAAINADTSLSVTAAQGTAPADNEVILTAKHKGQTGNAIALRVARRADEVVPTGLQVTVTAMTGGAGNPDITDALDVIAGKWFNDIAIPWDDDANLLAFGEELKTRFMAMGKLDGHGYVGTRGTFGQLTTKGAVTNCPHLTAIGAQGSSSAPWEWAASLAGIATFHLTNDPARQLRTLVLPEIDAPDPADRFTETEQDLLLRAGISTFNVLDDGTVTLDRVVTTYKQSPLGITDRAWLDIMVPKTLTRIRYDWASYVSLLYPRHKLSDDNSPAANNSDAVVTPNRMHGTWASRCRLYERQAWIEDATRTIAESRFYRSENDRNRMESNQQIQIIGNLMVLAAALEFQV